MLLWPTVPTAIAPDIRIQVPEADRCPECRIVATRSVSRIVEGIRTSRPATYLYVTAVVADVLEPAHFQGSRFQLIETKLGHNRGIMNIRPRTKKKRGSFYS